MTDFIDTAQERKNLERLAVSDICALEGLAHRLLDALDAERARAEKAEAERDEWKDEYQAVERLLPRYKDAATNRQAERDQALARLAAVQRDTREHAMLHVLTAPLFPPTLEADRAILAKRIGALPLDPDAEAALQRVVDEAWNVAVESAARVLMQDQTHATHTNWQRVWDAMRADAKAGDLPMAFYKALCALKRPEASHE